MSAEANGIEGVLRLLRFHGIVLVNASGISMEQKRESILSEAKTDSAAVDVALGMTFDPTASTDFSLKWKNELKQNLIKSGVIRGMV